MTGLVISERISGVLVRIIPQPGFVRVIVGEGPEFSVFTRSKKPNRLQIWGMVRKYRRFLAAREGKN